MKTLSLIACVVSLQCSAASARPLVDVQDKSLFDGSVAMMEATITNVRKTDVCLVNAGIHPSVPTDSTAILTFESLGSSSLGVKTGDGRLRGVKIAPGDEITITSKYRPLPISQIDFEVHAGGDPQAEERILEDVIRDARAGKYTVRVELLFVACSAAVLQTDTGPEHYLFRQGAKISHYTVDVGSLRITR